MMITAGSVLILGGGALLAKKIDSGCILKQTQLEIPDKWKNVTLVVEYSDYAKLRNIDNPDFRCAPIYQVASGSIAKDDEYYQSTKIGDAYLGQEFTLAALYSISCHSILCVDSLAPDLYFILADIDGNQWILDKNDFEFYERRADGTTEKIAGFGLYQNGVRISNFRLEKSDKMKENYTPLKSK